MKELPETWRREVHVIYMGTQTGEPGTEGWWHPQRSLSLWRQSKRKSRLTPLLYLPLLFSSVPLWLIWLARKGLYVFKKTKYSGKDLEESGYYRLEDLPASFVHTHPPFQTSPKSVQTWGCLNAPLMLSPTSGPLHMQFPKSGTLFFLMSPLPS